MANNTTALLYEHPNGTSVSGFLLDYPNTVLLDGTLGYFILGTVFVLTMVTGMRTSDTVNAYRAASFTSFISASLLAALGVIGVYLWSLTVIMLLTAFAIGGRGGRI